MKNGYKLGLAAVAASISLVGCGGGSSTPETVTGQFVDTYVEGLNYTCSSGATDVTNSMGEFTCNVGDAVTFSLGDYVLGTTTASSGIVTPETLYPENTDAALNVAQLLQTLDTDTTDDIISIDGNFAALDDVNTTPEDVNFDDLMETELEVALVTEEDAQNHLDEAELMVLLAGKTFYTVEADYLDRSVINADVTSSTWETIVGEVPGDTGTDTLVVNGGEITITSGEDGSVFKVVLAEETSDYLLLNVFLSDGTPDGEIRLYSDQAAAQAYYDSLQPEPTTPDTTTPDTTTPVYQITDSELYNKSILVNGVTVIFNSNRTGWESGVGAFTWSINASYKVILVYTDNSTETITFSASPATASTITLGSTPYTITSYGTADWSFALANYSYVFIYKNLSADLANTLRTTYENYNSFYALDLGAATAGNISCTDLGFNANNSTVTSIPTGYGDSTYTSYTSSDYTKHCSEYDYANVPNVGGSTDVALTYNL